MKPIRLIFACAIATVFYAVVPYLNGPYPSGQSCHADEISFRNAMAGAVRDAAAANLESVVAIEVLGTGDASIGEVAQNATTSGLVVDPSGLVIASSIVANQPSATLIVVLPGGKRLSAEVVARDQHRDLVLLKANSDKPIESATLLTDVPLQVGQTVIAVGRYGIDNAPMVSSGILSGEDRLDGIALQTDARVSPSLYGGPMIDLQGRVLGIMIPAVAEGGAATDTSWYDSGVAFAIPTTTIVKNLPQLRGGKDVKKGLVGIVAKSQDPMADDTTIAAVRTRSPAEKAGLQAGDEVLTIAGNKVQRHQQIRQTLGKLDAGDNVKLTVKRGDKEVDVEVTLADEIPPLQPQRLGVFAVTAFTNEGDAEGQQDVPKGIQVNGIIADTAADGKLIAGDVLMKVDNRSVKDVASLRRLMCAAAPRSDLNILVEREGVETAVKITTDDVDGAALATLPTEIAEAKTDKWQVSEVKLPEVANVAAVLRPENAAPDARLGLFVLLLNPGEGAPADELENWIAAAKATGVVVCAVAPQANERWKPQEIELVTRITTSVIKQSPIEPTAVAVGAPGALFAESAEVADSMALVVSMVSRETFFGAAISASTKVPAMRLRENEPATALQVLLPIEPEDELPTWSATFKRAGYPVARGGVVDAELLLRWVRCLQAI